MNGFQEYELSRHPELTGASSIVTPILAYNGGVLPETQARLDAVLDQIPQETKESIHTAAPSGD